MILPKQAKPITRKSSTAKIEAGVGQSGSCQMRCSNLPEPAKSICLQAC
jgi:hypothetical protein